MAAMVITALQYLKRHHFAYFFRIHVLLALGTTVGTLLHGFGNAVVSGRMPKSLPGAGFWLVDIILRCLLMNGVLPCESDY
jgi:hypothetical protein